MNIYMSIFPFVVVKYLSNVKIQGVHMLLVLTSVSKSRKEEFSKISHNIDKYYLSQHENENVDNFIVTYMKCIP